MAELQKLGYKKSGLLTIPNPQILRPADPSKGIKIIPQKQKSNFLKNNSASLLQGVSLLGNMASSAANASNTDYNVKYGRGDTSTEDTIAAGVGNVFPIFGAAYAAGNAVGSLWNKANKYDEDGFNHASGFQRNAYMAAGYAFNPVGGISRSLRTGGKGDGARALMTLINPIGAGLLQQKEEQEQALERRDIADKVERSGYEQNKFTYMPNLDV